MTSINIPDSYLSDNPSSAILDDLAAVIESPWLNDETKEILDRIAFVLNERFGRDSSNRALIDSGYDVLPISQKKKTDVLSYLNIDSSCTTKRETQKIQQQTNLFFLQEFLRKITGCLNFVQKVSVNSSKHPFCKVTTQIAKELLREKNPITQDSTHSFARGAQGKIYKGTLLDDACAIKVLITSSKGIRDQEFLGLTSFQHPNILQARFAVEDTFYMPLADGSLEDLWAQALQPDSQVTSNQIKQHITEIAEGVCFIHNQGYVHRDLKPANVLIKNQHALVSDFGLIDSSVNILKNSYKQSDAGTPLYMSPECYYALNSTEDTTLPFIEANNWEVGSDNMSWLNDSSASTEAEISSSLEKTNDSFSSEDLQNCYKRDVWSLGIMIWSLLSKGDRYHPACNHKSLDNKLVLVAAMRDLKGNENWHETLEDQLDDAKKAKYDPKGQLVDIMKACLIFDPQQRASMDEVVKALTLNIPIRDLLLQRESSN